MEYRSDVNSEISEAHSYYGLPTLKAPVWSWEIPAYFFVGGAAGAAAVIASTARLAGGRPDLVRDARWIAAIGGAISPPLLVADLGRPERFLNMLRVFKLQSPMSVGAWTLVAFSNASAAATFCDLVDRASRGRIPVRMIGNAAESLAAATGLVLSTYTGVLIGATAIPAWSENVAILPLHFAASGVGAAVSLLELMGHRDGALNALGAGAALVETLVGGQHRAAQQRGARPAQARYERHDHATGRSAVRPGASGPSTTRRPFSQHPHARCRRHDRRIDHDARRLDCGRPREREALTRGEPRDTTRHHQGDATPTRVLRFIVIFVSRS